MPNRSEIFQDSEKRFRVSSLIPKIQSKDSIAIVPNGYGNLGYAGSLAARLNADERAVHTIEVCGQGGNSGEYSIDGAALDLECSLTHLQSSGVRMHLLLHCSAALPIIHMGANSKAWTGIKSVILYSYLACPSEHLTRFRKKCERFGVALADDVGPVDCFGPTSYRNIPVPLSLVHPLSKDSLVRANREQLKELASQVSLAHISTPSYGYRISNQTQVNVVSNVVENQFLPLLNED